MPHSLLFGGLTGFAVCLAATALQSVHREASARDSAAVAGTGAATAHARAGPNASAAANANGRNDGPKTAAEMRQNPHYRFPIGSSYPNPSPMPGHDRPYAGTNNALSPGSGINHLRTR